MPQIKIERIISFTSEDNNHVASNILSKDSSKKWKCKTSGEKCASVVLQLDQPYVINAIDIGNENSAYIEVLVSRSSSPDDFKVLLVMSSFMSPMEARQTQNINKVRMFKQQDLSDPEKNEKWDRLKIVCTQPFNRHVQYGLSFINLYSPGDKNANKPQETSIGKFTIRPASPDSISAGSLFARRNLLQDNLGGQLLKGAAAIREATSLAHVGSPAPKQKVKHHLPASPATPQLFKKINNEEDDSTSTPKKRSERNRNELLYSKDEEDKHDKIDKLMEKRAEEKAEASRKHEKDKAREKAEKRRDTPSKNSEKKKDDKTERRTQTPNKTPSESKAKKIEHKDSPFKESLKRKQTADTGPNVKKQKKQLIEKPFARLLEGIVLVISGIQNPDRASLRSMALSMGAKYKADWDNNCTHLICAFANTPKFNQVKGKGKIVKRKWLEDCYNEHKNLPWRRYALDKADQGPESEEEICEKADTPSPEPQKKADTPSREPVDDYRINSDSDDDTRAQGSDTDEKIEEIRRRQKQSKATDIFSVDTDNESIEDSSHTKLEIKHKLNNFFEDKIFYVDEQFDEEVERQIKQYIVAYNGILVENLEVSIDIMVTNSQNYKVLKDIYPSAACVAPDWVWECHNCQKLVPMEDFMYK